MARVEFKSTAIRYERFVFYKLFLHRPLEKETQFLFPYGINVLNSFCTDKNI